MGTYSVSAGLHKLTALSKGRFILLTIDQVDDLYWAVVVVRGVINFVITVMNLYLASGLFFTMAMVMKYPAIIFFYIIEIVCLFVLSKEFKTTDSVCCFSHRHVLSYPHTSLVSTRVVLALCWVQFVGRHFLYRNSPSTDSGCHHLAIFSAGVHYFIHSLQHQFLQKISKVL